MKGFEASFYFKGFFLFWYLIATDLRSLILLGLMVLMFT